MDLEAMRPTEKSAYKCVRLNVFLALTLSAIYVEWPVELGGF